MGRAQDCDFVTGDDFLPVITPGFSAAAANGLLKTLNPATAPSSVAFALTSRNELALAATSNLAARP